MRVSFGTRIEPELKQRVKIYAAATDRTIEDVVEAALSGYLPPAPAEMAEARSGPGARNAEAARSEQFHLQSSAAPALGTPRPLTGSPTAKKGNR